MKNKIIFKMIAILAILISVSANAFAGHRANHSDYSGHWAEKQINEFIEKGFMGGYPDGSIRPDREITRTEFIILTNRVFGFTDKSSKSFTDIPKGVWYEDEILKAVKAGYISGYQDGTIKPNNIINRVEAADILSILLKWDKNAIDGYKVQYKDSEAIPKSSQPAFYTAVQKNYFKSSTDNWSQPYKNLTRAEAVILLYKARVGDIDKNLIPVSQAEKEIKGVLFTACCKKKSPEKETKACLSMPDCAENGYGVNVKQSDGSYIFLPFDSYGNELAKKDILQKTKKAANITINVKAVEGYYPGGTLKVLSIAEDNSETSAQGVQTLTGVLIDKHCFAYGEPETDSVECLKMKACEASGYGVAVKQSDGTYRFYKFDDKGHGIAKTILQNTLKENNIVVEAKGIVDGEIIQVTELTEK